MYRDTFVADKEINFIGMLLSLKNKAYPFMIANNVSGIIEQTSQVQHHIQQPMPMHDKQNIPENVVTQFPMPSIIAEQPIKHKIETTIPAKFPKQPKTRLPKLPASSKKVAGPLPQTQLTQIKQPPKNPALQSLNKLLKGRDNDVVQTTKTSEVSSNRTSDFNDVVDSIYNSLSD